ncbi:MAG: ParB/RepB/Spo0J family partition protein [Gemmatimonadota bacterium]
MTDKPRRLGRGLEALIAGAGSSVPTATRSAPDGAPESPLRNIPIADIRANPFQPRREFNPEELTDLENSIRASGLLQPVTVRPHPAGGFELVAGERRFRAVSRLGWSEILAIVKSLDDREMLTFALIENLQRADLNPLDEALGFQRLIDEFSLTQQQVAEAVGKDRSTVANLLRILQLPDGIKRLVRDGAISLGHARALLAMPNDSLMLDTARLIVDRGLSVREAERIAQDARVPEGRPKVPRPADRGRDAHVAELRRITETLRRHLQTDVRLNVEGDSKGDIAIRFYSADDLQRLLETILGRPLDDD